MKTPMKLTMAISILTLSLASSSWAAPHGKLGHDCIGGGSTMSQSSGHDHSTYTDTVPNGPRSKR